MEYVTLINRSSKTLQGTWDGRHFDIGPGKHSFPRIQAEKFKDQNPIMGSEDRYSLIKEYLMGIEDDNDDCSPIEQTDSVSLEDLREKIASGELRVVRGNGQYSHAVDAALPMPTDNGFVKP